MDGLNLVYLRANRVYGHISNGSQYKCLESLPGFSARLERIPDKWTFIAHDTYADSSGEICWGYSTGGHWPDGYPKGVGNDG